MNSTNWHYEELRRQHAAALLGPVSEPQDDGDDRTPTLSEFVDIGAKRSRAVIGAMFLVGTLGGVFVSLIQPNKFISTGQFMVRSGAREQSTPESTVDTQFATRGNFGGGADEVHLLSDPEICRRVAQEVGPENILQPYDPASEDTEQTNGFLRFIHRFQSTWFKSLSPVSDEDKKTHSPAAIEAAMTLIQNNLTLDCERNSNVVVVGYATHSPALAQRVVSAFLRAGQIRHSEVYAPGRQLSLVSEQAQQAATQYEAAASTFEAAKAECGFYDITVQKKDLITRIALHEAQLKDDETHLKSLDSQIQFITDEIGKTPQTVATTLPLQPMPNPKYTELTSSIAKLNDELGKLGDVYSPNSAEYKRRDKDLRDRLGKLETERNATPFQITTESTAVTSIQNPVYEDLVKRRIEIEQQRRGLAESIRANRGSLKEENATLEKLLLCEPSHLKMAQDVEYLAQQLKRLTTARDNTEVLNLVNRDATMSNLLVLQEATLPAEKAGPVRAKIVGVGIALGLFLGLGIAMLRFMLDTKLRSRERAERLLGLHVLAVVPESASWKRRGMTLLPPSGAVR